MELNGYSMTYLGEGKERTAVIYAASYEAAVAIFVTTNHPSKRLQLVVPLLLDRNNRKPKSVG